MKWRRLEAKFVLAVQFFTHLFFKVFLFWKPQKQLPKFLENFRDDSIFTMGVDERVMMPQFQKCQNCSLCTFSCTSIQQGKAPQGFEPKFLMLGFGRSSHETEYFLEEWLPCYECDSCTVDCPNQVPVHQMAKVIVERRKQLEFRV